MEELVDRAVAPWRFNLILVGVRAAAAVTLALVGILAVVASAVAQRTREIGIRMALGARPRQVVELVVRQGMALTWVGLAIGAGLSAVATRFLSVACLACALPARRATQLDPMIVLRHD